MIRDIFQNRFAETLGWSLIHSLWQLAAIAMLVAGVLHLLRRSKPQLRYLVACAGLISMLIVPAITYFVLLPAAPVALQPALHSDQVIAHDVSAVSIVIAKSTPHPQSAISRLRNALAPWLPLAVSVYALGATLMLARLVAGYMRIQTWINQGQWLEGSVASRVASLARGMGVDRLIRVIESTLIEVPTLIGAFKPVILIPASALSGLSAEQLDALLAHEIAHIRRHDYLVNLTQSVIETLMFYHPAVWWLSGQIRSEREFCCDDAAIAHTATPMLYARALATMETLRMPNSLAVAAAGGSLLIRVRRILGQSPSQSAKNQSSGAAVVMLLLIGACGVFAFNRPTSAVEHAKNPPATLPAHAAMPHFDPYAPEKAQVVISLKYMEVNNEVLAKLLGNDKDKTMLMNSDEADKAIKKLMADKNTALITAPRITVFDGQAAQIMVGQQVPLIIAAETPDKKFDVKYDNTGLRFDVKPTLSGNQITLEMEISVSKLTETGIQGTTGDDSTQIFPVIDERKFKTGVVISNDNTTLISSMSFDPGKSTLFIIHAKKVEPEVEVPIKAAPHPAK